MKPALVQLGHACLADLSLEVQLQAVGLMHPSKFNQLAMSVGDAIELSPGLPDCAIVQQQE